MRIGARAVRWPVCEFGLITALGKTARTMAHTIQWLPPPTARQLTFSESARAQKLRRRNVAGVGARVRKYKITCARACAYVCVWVRACAAREEYVVIKCLIARWKKAHARATVVAA